MNNNIDNIKEVELKNEKDSRCAPKYKFGDGSCIPLHMLIKMAEAYNAVDNKNPIKLLVSLETLNPKKYKKYLVKEFDKRLDRVCDDQRCWIKQEFVKKMNNNDSYYLKKKVFRPKGPNGKFTWLNTFNVNDVMEQYEDKYPEFKFFGAVPIDFDELSQLELSNNYNYNDLVKKGIYKIGVVFNLDEHYKSGSHWVSSYCDLKNGHVYYFDSYGYKPEKRIRKFLRSVAKYIQNTQKVEPVVNFNKVRHQYDNYDCGVYSINFIQRLLDGETFENITRNKTLDKDMNKNRDVYFS